MPVFILKENQYLCSSVVFAGFSSDALVTRIQDSKYRMLYSMQNYYYLLTQVKYFEKQVNFNFEVCIYLFYERIPCILFM